MLCIQGQSQFRGLTLRVIQTDQAKLGGFTEVRPGSCFELRQLIVQRVLEVFYPRVGDQRLLATAEKLIEQWQVGAVLEDGGDDEQVDARLLVEEVAGVAECHLIQLGIRAAGAQRQRIEVAGDDFCGASHGCSNGHYP